MSTRWRLFSASVAGAGLGAYGATCWASGILEPWGPVGASELQLLDEAVGAMLLVVVPVLSLTIFFAWWFRASNKRASYLPDWSYSGKIEFTIWVIPMLIVLFLATLAWDGSHELDPYRPLQSSNKRVRVEVVSLDWKWLFIYPELGVATVNELALPIDTPVSLALTSGTVMNAFFVPGLAGQIYTMAGMCTQMSVMAARTGEFQGLATQFSGDGFSDMHFKVLAMDRGGFSRWLDGVRQSDGLLDKAAYEKLLAARATETPAYFAHAQPSLFDYALQRGTRLASATVDRQVNPAEEGACRDMAVTNGVN